MNFINKIKVIILTSCVLIGILMSGLLSLISCSSRVQDGDPEKLFSLMPSVPVTGDPGLNNPIDPEINVPGLNMKSFLGGEYIKGGKTHKIKWFLEPVDAKDEGLYSTKIEFSRNNGTTWEVIADSVPSMGASLMEYDWVVSPLLSWETNTYKIKLTTTNAYGTRYTKETDGTFTVDNSPPVILANSLSVNDQISQDLGQGFTKIEVNRSYMGVSFEASDSLSPVTEYCIKMDSSVVPTEDAECWKIFANVDIEPSKNLKVTKAPVFIGFVPYSHEIRVWVKDAAGNISEIQNGTGLQNKDKTSINLVLVKPPEIREVIAANTKSPSIPPTREELSVISGSSVFIKWKILPNGKGQLKENKGISLEYTTDEETFLPITNDNVLNVQSGNCFADGDDQKYSGCYIWSGANLPVGGYFRVRVRAINDVGLVNSVATPPMNSGVFRNVAGNTDNSLGNSGESAIFSYSGGGGTERTNPGSIVVTSWGRVYIRDDKFGILSIDPSDGETKVYIKKGNPSLSVQPGEDQDISQAQTVPLRIALDYKDRLLILEKNRIRRVEKDGKVSTLVGVKPGLERFKDSGLVSGTDKVGWFDKNLDGQYKYLTSEGCFSTTNTKGIPSLYYDFLNTDAYSTFMWPLPNGDIYFSSAPLFNKKVQSEIGKAPYITVFKNKDLKGNLVNRIYPIRLCGVGAYNTKQDPYFNLSDTNLRSVPGLLFNPTNSYIESIAVRGGVPLADNISFIPSGLTFNPRSGKSRGSNTIYPNPIGTWGYASHLQSRKGALHVMQDAYGVLRYNASLNTWEKVFRDGRGQCFDETRALDCYVDILDYYLTDDNISYFYDRGRIRAIVNNKVRTILGQSRKFGNEGSPFAARFNMIEHFGVWGASGSQKIIVFDTRENAMREIEPGQRIRHIMGNEGEGKCEINSSDGNLVCQSGFYSWGTSNSAVGNSFNSSTKTGDLKMSASVYKIQYWDWSTGFVVDPDNGDIYSQSSGGPRNGIARFYRNSSGDRYGQMILGAYNDSKTFLSSNASSSCNNNNGFSCDISTVPRSPYFSSAYPAVIPAFGIDFMTGKKTILATTHDWSYASTDSRGNQLGSYKQCYMKALRLPTSIPDLSPIASADLSTSLVQHVMGKDGDCAGYSGVTERISNVGGTILTGDNNFPSWHSTTIPHRFIPTEDSLFMSWRGSNTILKIDFVRASVAGVGTNVIVGSRVNSIAAALPHSIFNYNFKKNGDNKNVFYYCASNAKLYKFVVNGANGSGTATELMLPSSSMGCSTRGKTLEWTSNSKEAFYFVYQQNGLDAIGEYYVGSN